MAGNDLVRWVEPCMGTVFSLVVADEGEWSTALTEVVEWLHLVDRTFSTYREDSAISRLRRGESVDDSLVHEVLELCERYEEETDGAFSASFRGDVDPTGLVKGWAIERASEILRRHGSANHAVNGGGDVQAAGEPASGRPWRIGIADPGDSSRVLTTVEGRDFAVATSGTAERGRHIVDPRSGRPADAVASVSVIGASLTWVDVAATAAFVMGGDALAWLASKGLKGIVVELDGTVRSTDGPDAAPVR